jgi:hypothetical protein
MGTQRTQGGRPNALREELRFELREACRAPAATVYGLLADVRSHLVWAGEMQPKRTFRLLSVDAPEGEAGVGTEFRTTGADPSGGFEDASVVTEAVPGKVFEFVTEARLRTRKGVPVDWTNVHRYELEPTADGCTIVYVLEIARISDLPGAMAVFRVPGLRRLGLKASASYARRGLRNLARLAEERAAA